MRIVSNGAICAVNAREMRRAEKWRQKQKRQVKSGKGEKNGKAVCGNS